MTAALLIATLGILTACGIAAREHGRPTLPRYGEAFGDVPAVPSELSHFGTPFSTGAKQDHVGR